MPGEEDGYRVSRSFLAVKHLFDLLTKRSLDVVGDHILPFEKTQASGDFFRSGLDAFVKATHLNHGFAGYCDDEGMAIGRILDEAREVGLGLVDVDHFQSLEVGCCSRIHVISPVNQVD